jgi:DNA-binding Lrp family transcriptional regulator
VDSVSIDVLDHRIIHALHIDPRAPFSRLSEVLGTSEQTIARRYRRLFDDRVMRVVGQLDSQRLGRSDWAVRIRCAPASAFTVATTLAEHPDTGWVQLISGGTEIFSTIYSRDPEQRTPPLLSQLPLGRQVVALSAYCLLHLFNCGPSSPPGPNALCQNEIDRLQSSARAMPPVDRSTVRMQDSDWPLIQALAEDGRATFRQLAARTHWHESTARRRVEELIASGVLSFEVNLDTVIVGVRSSALLWMSVVPSKLVQVGQALADRPEIPFVSATTGSTNLIAAVRFDDDESLYKFITTEIGTLEGLTHIETTPIMQAIKMHATMTPPSGVGSAVT